MKLTESIKINCDFGSEDMYRFFKENNPDSGVSISDYRAIFKDYVEMSMANCIDRNIEMYLHYGMGMIRVKRIKRKPRLLSNGAINPRYSSIDYVSSKKMWIEMYPGLSYDEIKKIPNKKAVYFLNEHTNGERLKFYWDRLSCTYKNICVYKFRVQRKWNRLVSKRAKEKKVEYNY